MKWKQFFTPVQSMNADQARNFMQDKTLDNMTILDVRQSKEYETGHIPGAKLIPIAELDDRLDEIDKNKSTVVYCAIGGRSRMAAQILSGKGFNNIVNMSGGFKAWNGEAAYGDLEQGLDLFSGDESPEYTLAVAYSLEDGLRDFYVTMANKVSNDSAKNIFIKLSKIEVKHQDRLYNAYEKLADNPLPREEFINVNVAAAIEGGMTTEEFINMYQPDMESPQDIIAIAMSIEAQALDLYHRASEKAGNPESQKALKQLADEEKVHIKELGKLMDNL